MFSKSLIVMALLATLASASDLFTPVGVADEGVEACGGANRSIPSYTGSKMLWSLKVHKSKSLQEHVHILWYWNCSRNTRAMNLSLLINLD